MAASSMKTECVGTANQGKRVWASPFKIEVAAKANTLLLLSSLLPRDLSSFPNPNPRLFRTLIPARGRSSPSARLVASRLGLPWIALPSRIVYL
ncbi:hypothetical protein OPV22_001444 [Ensete ventricosum]|uniref:Uncharacterized protein n=1 Tax=Ensete ventricosum TaxID=4639 RepID=A0AAV8QDU8_ENSVE|nr:hypothetical protein OPV22_001444 [Ensete ventricosum]